MTRKVFHIYLTVRVMIHDLILLLVLITYFRVTPASVFCLFIYMFISLKTIIISNKIFLKQSLLNFVLHFLDVLGIPSLFESHKLLLLPVTSTSYYLFSSPVSTWTRSSGLWSIRHHSSPTIRFLYPFGYF